MAADNHSLVPGKHPSVVFFPMACGSLGWDWHLLWLEWDLPVQFSGSATCHTNRCGSKTISLLGTGTLGGLLAVLGHFQRRGTFFSRKLRQETKSRHVDMRSRPVFWIGAHTNQTRWEEGEMVLNHGKFVCACKIVKGKK